MCFSARGHKRLYATNDIILLVIGLAYKMKKSTLLIRDYNDIRRILRDIYIFGCYSREDFIGKGFSGRKYDYEQRRINAYLPEEFLKKALMT